jgi:tripartite-type tricarboxylate transporter receptor subunit TctC
MSNQEQEQMIKLILTPLAMSRPFAAPPDLPADRKQALISAFEKAASDPQFELEGEQMKLDVDLVPAGAIEKMLAEAYATPQATLAKTANAISR